MKRWSEFVLFCTLCMWAGTVYGFMVGKPGWTVAICGFLTLIGIGALIKLNK